MKPSTASPPRDILATAQALRWEVGEDFHEKLMEALYTNATEIADRAVTRPGEKPRFDLDRSIDRIVTSRRWGFLLMILLFTLVFWITITGANYPSGWLAKLLLDMGHPALRNLFTLVGSPWWLTGLVVVITGINAWNRAMIAAGDQPPPIE